MSASTSPSGSVPPAIASSTPPTPPPWSNWPPARRVPAWEARDDVTRVAYVDRRTAAQRAEFDRLEASVGERLLAIGRDDLAAEWEANLFTASLDTDVPDDVRDDMIRVLDLGVPAAVYLAPPPEP